MFSLPLLLALIGVAAGTGLALRKFLVEPRYTYAELPEFYTASAYLVDAYWIKTAKASPGQTLNMWILLYLGSAARTVSVKLIGPGLNVEMPPTILETDWGTSNYSLRVPFVMGWVSPGRYVYSLQVSIDGQTQEFPQTLEVV